METKKEPNALAILPDASTRNPDPNYIRSLLERAGISQRGAARLVGFNDRTMRDYVSGQAAIPYSAQYCLEVLARGGVADTPEAPPVWFKTAQRPLRKDDVGRIVVGLTAGLYVVGRVGVDGFGVVIEPLPGNRVDGGIVSAGAISEYVLVDDVKP